jgi:hypothetical protein
LGTQPHGDDIFFIIDMCSVRGIQARLIEETEVVMGSSEYKGFRLYAAVLFVSITVMELESMPLVAQVSVASKNASCLHAKVTPLVPLVASVLPSLTDSFIAVEMQTLTGRLTCADSRPAFYNCGHTKQSVWGCKPDCFLEPDGSQYVLESLGRSYSVIGDPNQIRQFLTDEVAVTGKLKGETIKAISISKAWKKNKGNGMRSAYAPWVSCAGLPSAYISPVANCFGSIQRSIVAMGR